MKSGKLSETIYDRTVYKTVQAINKSADLRENCTFLSGTGATGAAAGKDVYVLYRACMEALHKLAENGINPLISKGNFEVSLEIFFPTSLREAKLRSMIDYCAKELAKLNVVFGNINVTVQPGIEEALASAFANTDITPRFVNKSRPDQDVVMTKWMGLEGSALIAQAKHRELETRYPIHIIEDTCKFIDLYSVLPEAAGAVKSNVSAMHAIREGGVFGGLWELAKRSDVGLVIDLKKIPVKQETIEVCEFYDINPYKLLGGGSLLITCDNGMTLVSELNRQGIEATVIGKTTSSNDRIINNEEDTRFLEPAREDEYYKVMYSQDSKEEE